MFGAHFTIFRLLHALSLLGHLFHFAIINLLDVYLTNLLHKLARRFLNFEDRRNHHKNINFFLIHCICYNFIKFVIFQTKLLIWRENIESGLGSNPFFLPRVHKLYLVWNVNTSRTTADMCGKHISNPSTIQYRIAIRLSQSYRPVLSWLQYYIHSLYPAYGEYSLLSVLYFPSIILPPSAPNIPTVIS